MNGKVKEAVEFGKRHKWKIVSIASIGVGICIGCKLNDRKYNDVFSKTLKRAMKNPDIIGMEAFSNADVTDVAQKVNDFINTYGKIDDPANLEIVNHIIFCGREK